MSAVSSASFGDVPIEAIASGVAFAADEPAAIESGFVIERLIERLCANGCLTRRPPRTTRGPVASSYRLSW